MNPGPKGTKTTFEGCESEVYNSLLGNCRRRKIYCRLKFETVKNLLAANCFYCGAPPRNRIKRLLFTYLYQGIDRLNNDKGYVDGNVLPCCGACNSIKGKHLSHEEMLLVAQMLKTFRRIRLVLPREIQDFQARAGSTR